MKRTKGNYRKGDYREFINGHNTRVLSNEEQLRRAMFNDGSSLRGKITGSGNAYTKYRQNHLHRVVAAQKLGRSLIKGEIVHHINGNKHDNCPGNIEVLTSQTEHINNHRDKIFSGRKLKLTIEEVRDIRDFYKKGGFSQESLARIYGVTQTRISAIVRNISYKEKQGDQNYD
jgi:predicted XRE-type DNA-binding protein